MQEADDTKFDNTDKEGHNDDDVSFEDAEETAVDMQKKLRKRLKEVQKEKQDYLDGWQRAKAEFLNYKKESLEREAGLHQRVRLEFIEQLLPVLDSFEMAFQNKDLWNLVDKNWRTGVEHIYEQCRSILNENGITEIHPLGEVFDPTQHESLELTEVHNKSEHGKVVRVVQKGYRTDDMIIRAPKVNVGNYA